MTIKKKAGLAALLVPLAATVALSGCSAVSNTAEPAATAETLAAKKIKMAEVAKHNTATNCWTVISGKVYDVTTYVNRHPNGKRDITGMCGTDGTAKYKSEHGRKDPKKLAGKNSKYVVYKGVKA